MNGRRSGKGQALIEFALVLPLLFLLILNLVNFGAFVYAWISVANAARSATQYMIMGTNWVGNPNAPDSSAGGPVTILATNDAWWLPNRASLQVATCKNYNDPSNPATCGGVWGPPTDAEAAHYVAASVDVSYAYQPLIPFWSFPNLGIHLTLPPTTIHRRVVMRMVQ